MSSIQNYELVAVLVILAAAVLLTVVWLLRRYRERRLREMREASANPAFSADRAFNRLALARREADLLEIQGGDAAPARQLIHLAQQSLDGRNPDRAYELAQAAHETLVQARREPGRPKAGTTGAGPDPLPVDRPSLVAGAASPTPSPRPPEPTIQRRAEAQFQLHLFEQELATAAKAASGAPPNGVARDLYVQAHAAFDRSDFPEAFRLALRGRRALGARVETLGGATSLSPGPDGPPSGTSSAEEFAGQGRCPACGHPLVPGDAFCRGCGAARAPGTCRSCGQALGTADTYCGKCGAAVS